MLFGNQVQIRIDVVDIERASENKFLVVIMDDNNLKYSKHNVSQSISILSKLRYFTGHILLHVLYFSLISPCLNWG